MATAVATPARDWRAVVAAKRASIQARTAPYAVSTALLPPAEQTDVSRFFEEHPDVLSPRETQITELDDATTLLGKIETGEWAAVDVVTAYIKRATATHQLCNVLTEPVFTRALSRAATLDQHLTTHGTPIGPLHGLPITLKEQFAVVGADTTITYTALVDQPCPNATSQSVLVNLLESLGAIVIAKSTIPQSIMWCETESPLFGLTCHPQHREFTPGGSSGGEGVLLAMRGSPLGFGTDIGGSVRIPAALAGGTVYSLKPSAARLPYAGTRVSTEGQEHVPSSIGPMARNVATLTLAMRELVGTQPWRVDPNTVPLPWRQSDYDAVLGRPLRIAVLADDGVVRPHPPVTRVLAAAVAALQSEGHEVTPWPTAALPLHKDAIEVMDAFYTADGGEDVRRAVQAGGEPLLPHVDALLKRAGAGMSVFEYWQLNRRKWAVQRAYAALWNKTATAVDGEIDFILMPVMPHSALRHRGCRWIGYTKIWNVLDYSAGVVPAGSVDLARDRHPDSGYTATAPRNDLDRWNCAAWERDSGDGMHGMPVALQIVGRRYCEERVLAGMHVLDGVLARARARGDM